MAGTGSGSRGPRSTGWCVGSTVADFWSGLVAGTSGVGRITQFDPSHLGVQIAGEVRGFDPATYMPRTVSRRIDSYAQYALGAAVQAMESAKLEPESVDATRVGVLVGSAYGPVKTIERNLHLIDSHGPRRVSPYFSAVSAIDNAAGEIAIRFGARGPSGSITTACATGSTCVGEAMRHIQHGYADVMIAGGADDSVTQLDVAATDLAGALSRRNDDPAGASRPFDRNRDGFVLSAGAGVVVLEELEFALARGAQILAEVVGYGATTDVYHPTAPHPEGLGARNAIQLALADAGVTAEAIDYVNAHGTSTPVGDRVELLALRTVLGDRVQQVPISSIKSMTGHMLGAAGAVELIATVEAIRTSTVPPTINCSDPEEPDLDLVTTGARSHQIQLALSNSFGFAGHKSGA